MIEELVATDPPYAGAPALLARLLHLGEHAVWSQGHRPVSTDVTAGVRQVLGLDAARDRALQLTTAHAAADERVQHLRETYVRRQAGRHWGKLPLGEALEHLDPRNRWLVGRMICELTRSGAFEQTLVATYDESLVRRLVRQGGDLSVRYLTAGTADA